MKNEDQARSERRKLPRHDSDGKDVTCGSCGQPAHSELRVE